MSYVGDTTQENMSATQANRCVKLHERHARKDLR